MSKIQKCCSRSLKRKNPLRTKISLYITEEEVGVMLSLTLSSTGLLVINKPSRSISTNFGRMHWHVLSLLWNIDMPSEITSKYSPTQKSDAPSRLQVLRIPRFLVQRNDRLSSIVTTLSKIHIVAHKETTCLQRA